MLSFGYPENQNPSPEVFNLFQYMAHVDGMIGRMSTYVPYIPATPVDDAEKLLETSLGRAARFTRVAPDQYYYLGRSMQRGQAAWFANLEEPDVLQLHYGWIDLSNTFRPVPIGYSTAYTLGAEVSERSRHTPLLEVRIYFPDYASNTNGAQLRNYDPSAYSQGMVRFIRNNPTDPFKKVEKGEAGLRVVPATEATGETRSKAETFSETQKIDPSAPHRADNYLQDWDESLEFWNWRSNLGDGQMLIVSGNALAQATPEPVYDGLNAQTRKAILKASHTFIRNHQLDIPPENIEARLASINAADYINDVLSSIENTTLKQTILALQHTMTDDDFFALLLTYEEALVCDQGSLWVHREHNKPLLRTTQAPRGQVFELSQYTSLMGVGYAAGIGQINMARPTPVVAQL